MSFVDSPMSLRDVGRYWWLYLVSGIVWILFGMWLWSYRVGSLVALAVLIGVTMIFNGVTEIMVSARLPVLRSLVAAIGVLSVAGGITIMTWPDPTLYIIAVFLGWFLFVMGIVHVVRAFARMGTPYWWLLLVQGGAEFVLGAYARGDHARSLFLFVNLAGAFCVFRGIYQIFAAFELQRLSKLDSDSVSVA